MAKIFTKKALRHVYQTHEHNGVKYAYFKPTGWLMWYESNIHPALSGWMPIPTPSHKKKVSAETTLSVE